MNYECCVKFKDGTYVFSYAMLDEKYTKFGVDFIDDALEFDCTIATDEEDLKEITLTVTDLVKCSRMVDDISNINTEDIGSIIDYIGPLSNDNDDLRKNNMDITRMLILIHSSFDKIGCIKDIFIEDIMDILSKDVVNVLRVADYLCMNEIVNKLLAMKIPIEGMDFTILNHNLKYWDVIDNWSRGYKLYCTKVIHEILDSDIFKEATRRGMPVEEIRRESPIKIVAGIKESRHRERHIEEKTSLDITNDTIQYCYGLKILDLGGNLKITSLEPFANVLEELYHGGYYPNDQGCSIGINQDQIMQCPNLRFLHLECSLRITDLPISLISLSLRNEYVTYEQLMKCTNLRELKILQGRRIRKIPPMITKLTLGHYVLLDSHYRSEVISGGYDEFGFWTNHVLLWHGRTIRETKVSGDPDKYAMINMDNIEHLELLNSIHIIPVTGSKLNTLVLDDTYVGAMNFFESPNIENLTVTGVNDGLIFQTNINWPSVQNLKIEGDDAHIAQNIKDSGIKVLEIINTHRRKGFFDNNNDLDRKDYFYFDEPEYNTIFNKRKHVNFDSFKYLETLVTYGCVELTKDTCIKYLTCRAVSGERPSGIRILLWDSIGNKVLFNDNPFERDSESA